MYFSLLKFIVFIVLMFQSKQKSDDKAERDDADIAFHTSQSIALPYPSPQKTLSLKVKISCPL